MIPIAIPIAIALVAPLALPQDDARPVASRIVEVTVYPGSASVKRNATLPAGGGSFVIEGLPASIDPNALRVSTAGAEVVGIELRERFQRIVPDERVQELRDRVRELEHDLQTVRGEAHVLERLQEHLDHLMRRAERAHGHEVGRGQASPDTWERSFAYVRTKLTEVGRQKREVTWRIEAAEQALKDARLELGRFESTSGVTLFDLYVDVFDTSGAATSMDVEYVVGNASWTPSYDLRATKDLSGVELVYRAKVVQLTGEDWSDVDLQLSTAQPLRGAQGPEPPPIWLSLVDPRKPAAGPASPAPSADGLYLGAEFMRLEGLGDEDAGEAALLLFAEVSDQGLSVRFRLAQKETVESREQPTTVLVGRETLAIEPEHFCVPALDTTVWLRAKAKNTSKWVMLPGRAAVYFGADFIGYSSVPAVQLEEELTVHLGPDQGLAVERTKLEDVVDRPGVFGKNATLERSWRIRIKNNGAFTKAPDGSVSVIVQEVLPRATDDRIEVELARAEPALSRAERWKKDREEQGVLTWRVRVPRGGETVIELTTEISYPENLELIQR